MEDREKQVAELISKIRNALKNYEVGTICPDELVFQVTLLVENYKPVPQSRYICVDCKLPAPPQAGMVLCDRCRDDRYERDHIKYDVLH